MTRQQARIDVHLVLRRGQEILLGRRPGTSTVDGSWHPPSGHVDDGESATTALIRVALELTGVRVEPAYVRLRHLMHHHTDTGRIALFFDVIRWTGTPINPGPDTCAGWDWFSLDGLPDPMNGYTAEALTHYRKGELYAEYGWPHP